MVAGTKAQIAKTLDGELGQGSLRMLAPHGNQFVSWTVSVA